MALCAQTVVLSTTAVTRPAAPNDAKRAAQQKEAEELGVRDEITSDVIETLRIPRRPAWTKTMSAEELDRIEKDSFLEWRRALAQYVI
jgi:hypothetical protein